MVNNSRDFDPIAAKKNAATKFSAPADHKKTINAPMTPIRFGPTDQQLFGLYLPSTAPAPHRGALLICNPWGQEAVRTHRLLRVLSERLARAGWHVLHFDYFGTGESLGEDTQGHLMQWQLDVQRAHQELQRRALGLPITWLGLRLGGTIAAQAAEQGTEKPDHLLLWEPITDGPAYLTELARAHTKAIQASFGIVPAPYQNRPAHEALGFGLGAALISELAQLQTLPTPAATPLTWISATPPATTQRPSHHTHQTFKHTFDWTTEEALNTALVPHEALNFLFNTIDQVHPK